MKKALIAVAVLAAAGAAAWKVSAFERAARHAMTEYPYIDDDQWKLLAEHPDDPRVQRAARYELHNNAIATQSNELAMRRIAMLVGPTLERIASNDDAVLDDVARLITLEGDVRPRAWTTRSTEDLVVAMTKLEHRGLFRHDGRTSALERLKPAASAALVYVLALDSEEGPGSLAARHLAAGVPPDGQPFVPLAETVERVPPRDDPRYMAAIAGRVRDLTKNGTFPEEVASINRLVALGRPPPLDAAMAQALAQQHAIAGVAELSRALIAPHDVALVQANAPAEVAALLTGSFDRPDALRSRFESLRGMQHSDHSLKQLDTAAAQIAEYGPAAARALTTLLTDPDWGVRRAASLALVKVDRQRWAVEIAAATRASRVSVPDAELAVELARTPPVMLDPLFAAFSLGDAALTTKVASIVTKEVAPRTWVPAMFENLSTATSLNVSAVSAYDRMLAENADVGSLVARELHMRFFMANKQAEAVPWLVKKVAIQALGARGTKTERYAVELFTSDTTVIEVVTTTRKRDGFEKVSEKREQVKVSELAARALAQMK